MVDRTTQTALAEEFAQRADSIVVVAGIRLARPAQLITYGLCRLVELRMQRPLCAPEAADQERHLGEITANFVATIRRSLVGASGP
jgi:hypothetical protein